MGRLFGSCAKGTDVSERGKLLFAWPSEADVGGSSSLERVDRQDNMQPRKGITMFVTNVLVCIVYKPLRSIQNMSEFD